LLHTDTAHEHIRDFFNDSALYKCSLNNNNNKQTVAMGQIPRSTERIVLGHVKGRSSTFTVYKVSTYPQI